MSLALSALRSPLLRILATKKRVLFFIACVVFILDQRRRSRAASSRYRILYSRWSKEAATASFLQRLHADIKSLLGKHDPPQLRAALRVPKVDLAIAGGGAKAVYAMGAYIVLQHAGVHVDRVSGASAGAYLAALCVGDRYQLDDLLQENLLGWGDCVVQVIQEHKTLFLGKIWEFMSSELTKRLSGWLPHPGKLLVSVTTVATSGLEENIAGQFDSAEDLEQTICASMSVPFILCDGPFYSWRGQYAIDGGFKNNCPVSAFCHISDTKPPKGPMSMESSTGRNGSRKLLQHMDQDKVIVKVDCNRISTMPAWRKILHVVYAPGEVLGNLIFEGAQDMLEILSSEKEQVSGITLIRPCPAMKKRDFSYQLLPGTEHVGRLVGGRNVF